MNFDGKAYVKNINTRLFVSEHGYAFVRNSKINNLIETKDIDTAFIIPTSMNMTNSKELHNTKPIYVSGLIPYTIQVYKKEKIQELLTKRFIIIKDSIIHDKQKDFLYTKVYVSKLQPTNIKYNPKSAIVINSLEKESVLSFASVSVNVNSKIEVIIPDKTTNYSDMSLVVQKNSFIEIQLPNSVSNIENLPDDLIYLPGYIKGTFTKSGEYNIKLKYPDGEQILNIIVPYYQRLL